MWFCEKKWHDTSVGPPFEILFALDLWLRGVEVFLHASSYESIESTKLVKLGGDKSWLPVCWFYLIIMVVFRLSLAIIKAVGEYRKTSRFCSGKVCTNLLEKSAKPMKEFDSSILDVGYFSNWLMYAATTCCNFPNFLFNSAMVSWQ